MKSEKKYFIKFIGVIITMIVLVGGFVFVIDPYFHYHKPLSSLKYPLYNSNYQNPGIVRNFDYDTLITGSSMTENFKTSLFEEVLGHIAVKVPYGGATSKNLNTIVSLAAKNQDELVNVYWGLDLYALENSAYEYRNPLPLYLYDNNIFNDFSYLLNGTVIKEAIIDVFFTDNSIGYDYDFDGYTNWADKFEFGHDIVLKGYTKIDQKEEKPKDFYMKAVKENLKVNIIPLIELYPDINFTFFLPPYSDIYWQNRKNEGDIESVLFYLEYTLSELIDYGNVQIYYFQNESEIISNLDNYKDYTHYSQQINDYMVEAFKMNKHKLTKENISSNLKEMRDIIDKLNYE